MDVSNQDSQLIITLLIDQSVLAQSDMCISGGKQRSFFGKFGVLCILVTFVLRFALLPYYRRVILSKESYILQIIISFYNNNF